MRDTLRRLGILQRCHVGRSKDGSRTTVSHYFGMDRGRMRATIARTIRFLEKEGYVVDVAMSTSEASGKVTDAEKPYRLCILDQSADTDADALFQSLARGAANNDDNQSTEDDATTNTGIPLLIVANSKEDGDTEEDDLVDNRFEALK